MFVNSCDLKGRRRRGKKGRSSQPVASSGVELSEYIGNARGWLVWKAAYRLAGLISNLWQQYVPFHASSSFPVFNTNWGHSIYGNHCLQGKKIKKGEIAALTSLASENMF